MHVLVSLVQYSSISFSSYEKYEPKFVTHIRTGTLGGRRSSRSVFTLFFHHTKLFDTFLFRNLVGRTIADDTRDAATRGFAIKSKVSVRQDWTCPLPLEQCDIDCKKLGYPRGVCYFGHCTCFDT